MKRIVTSTLFAASMALAGMAQAQEGYVGLGVGQSRADVDCTGTLSCDKTDTAFKLYGGYMFMPNFGVEGGYHNLGKFKATFVDNVLGTVNSEFKGDGFALFGVAAYPIDQFSVFGKLGFASTKIKLSASAAGASASQSDRSTNVAWGLGAGYKFTKELGARAEFERFRAEFQGEKDDINVFSIGLQYSF
jgi:OmpA-OmpF porin, OOP family